MFSPSRREYYTDVHLSSGKPGRASSEAALDKLRTSVLQCLLSGENTNKQEKAVIMKRVFTKMLYADGVIEASNPAEWVTTLCAAEWKAQEKLEVLGFILRGELCSISENDGNNILYAELSFEGKLSKDGALGRIQLFERWNTLPAFGEYVPQQLSFMLPAGYFIPMTEGEVLYLHIHHFSKTAGTTSWSALANVYYIKGV